MATPTLVQHLSSASGNPGGFGQAGNVFRFQLPNSVLVGNCLVLGISYGFKATRTIAITDNNGNTWPAAAVEANAGAGSLISDIFVLPNANAGPTRITVTFDGGARTIAASPTGATEAGTTCTITTTTPHGLEVNDQIYIQGVGVAGYNGLNVFQVASVPTTTTFTYVNTVSGLAASGGGTVIVMVQPIQYKVSEYYNVATVSPVNGSSSGALTAAPNISSGSFTPGNNDANGGNLIWSYFIDNNGGTANGATLFAPTGSFALLDADTSQSIQSAMPHASEAFVQTTAAAINPGMTITMAPAAGDTFNAASVALKAATAGTAPPPTGIRILHLCHFTSNVNTGVTAYHLQLPSAGNLIVLATHEQGGHNITSITDSKSNTYVREEPDLTEPQIWHADNATSDPDLRITVNVTGVLSGFTFFWYDIIGAAAAPVDGVVGSTGGNDVGGANIADQPIITPASIGLTIVALKMGIGPTSGFDTGAPAGAVFDAVWYPGETDSDALDNADGRGHVYNADLTTEHWNWVVQNQSRDTSFASTAVHFKAATTAAFEDDSWSRPFVLPDDLVVSVWHG